jgi:hypothetical protein
MAAIVLMRAMASGYTRYFHDLRLFTTILP